MANLQTTIELIFQGVDQTGTAIESVSSGLSKINDKVGNAAQPLADFTTGLLKVEGAAIATGVALLAVATDQAGKFEESFREIATLTDQPVEGLQNFRTAILEYASTSTQSLDSVTSAVYAAISGGVEYTKSLAFVAAAEKLAVAGKAELGQTLTGLISTLNAYGAGVDQAGKYSDVFFTAVRLGQTTLPELNASLSGVTSTAVLGGQSFETVAAAIATLTASGAPTSEAITRLNAALSAIINPSSQAAKLAKDLGIEFDLNTLKSKGFAGVLADVAAKTGGAGDKMAVLFGSTEALNAVNVLAISSASKFKSNLDEIAKSAGATDTAFGKMQDATDTLAQAIAVAAVKLGTPFLDSQSTIEDAIASIVTTLGAAFESGALSGFKENLVAVATSIATAFEDIAKNLPDALNKADYSGFTAGLERLRKVIKDAFGDLFVGIDVSTPEGLAKAITALGSGFEKLAAYTAGAVSQIGPLIENLAKMGGWIAKLDPDTYALAGTVGGLATAFVLVGPAVSGVITTMELFGGALKSLPAALTVVRTEMALMSGVVGSGSLAAALGTAGIAGAVGVLAFELTQLSGLDNVLNDVLAPDAVFGKGATLGTIIADLAENLGLLGGAAEKPQPPISELSKELDRNIEASQKSRTEINAWMDAQEAAAKVPADTTKELEKLTASYAAAGYQYDATTGQIRAMASEEFQRKVQLSDLRETFLAAERDQTGYVGSIKDGVVTYTQWGNALAGAKKKAEDLGDTLKNKTAKDILEATKVANDFQAKMEQIASNERIKNIEAVVSIKTEALKADAERVKATFESIDNTVSSTGDLLGSLFGAFNTATSNWDKAKIEDQIALENKRRQDALELQKKLAEAEIERIQAQTESLNRGDALIKIEGSGLKPELEAFMWKILSLIRVRANAEFSQYLLGVASP